MYIPKEECGSTSHARHVEVQEYAELVIFHGANPGSVVLQLDYEAFNIDIAQYEFKRRILLDS